MLALYAALGLAYAGTSLRGESIYVMAYKQGEVSNIVLDLLRAEAIFPLSSRIREANAGFLARLNDVPPKVALVAVRRALRNGPDHPGLLYALIVNLIRDGDRAQAAEVLEHLRRIAPDWPMTLHAQALIGG